MTVREALGYATRLLAGLSETPRLDAELLMAKAVGAEREDLLLSDLSNEAPEGYEALVARRAAGEPVAYITGRRAFWTIELAVAPGVLIPRPDSETLIDAAVAHFGAASPARILDLGTGSGALLLAALDQWPAATGVGIDVSGDALAIARANAQRLGFSARARFREGDWDEGLDGSFDLILCNPPYIEDDAVLPRDVADWEPREALFAGPDGLDCYRRLAPAIARLLAPAGIACVEVGAGQAQAVAALFAAEGLAAAMRNDLAGNIRCLFFSH